MMDNYHRDILNAYLQSSVRGLKQSAKWAAELLSSLPDSKLVNIGNISTANTTMNTSTTMDTSIMSCMTQVPTQPMDVDYMLGKSLFDLFEYERASFFTSNCKTREGKFLYYYSRYLSVEKKRQDLLVETSSSSQLTTPSNCTSMDVTLGLLSCLRSDLQEYCMNQESHQEESEDSYILYVYAIVLVKLDLNEEAIKMLCRSIKADPCNWASWHQLALLVDDKDVIESFDLPSNIFKRFFIAEVCKELQLNEEALEIYEPLLETFEKSNYIKTMIAIIKNNLKDMDAAVELFKEIREKDPYRLDSMDIYSNVLYVKDLKSELSILAHAVNNVDPFRVESCICIANFYSLRRQHSKAVVYFSRALQLNPKYSSPWTLIGHEYMEMKNTGAAIQAYRSAIRCNKRDYRAWYGLGQTYEILKMHSYCLYYYTIARSIRPNDPIMSIAMGETLEKLDRHSDALKCYWKAGFPALTKLATLYEKMEQKDKAAAAFKDFIEKNRSLDPVVEFSSLATNSVELATAYRFISTYYFEQKKYDEAYLAAEKCTMFTDSTTREHGRNLQAQISKARPTVTDS